MAAAQVTGLECLSQLTNIMMHQSSTGYKGNNYTIFGDGEEVLFTLNEIVPDTIFRGGSQRAFKFDGVDNTGRKVQDVFEFNLPSLVGLQSYRVQLNTSILHGATATDLRNPMLSFHRPTGRIFISSKVELFINEELVSIIHLVKTFITPIFSIHDAQDNPTLRLKGKITDTHNFELQTNTKAVIGGLQQKSRGWREDMFSLKDDYIISFPADLAVQFKLAVIVASVYVDFRFHEGK